MYESTRPAAARGVDLKALTTDLAAGLEQSLAATEQVPVSIIAMSSGCSSARIPRCRWAFLMTELISCAARAAAPGALDARIEARAEASGAMLRISAPPFAGEELFAAVAVIRVRASSPAWRASCAVR